MSHSFASLFGGEKRGGGEEGGGGGWLCVVHGEGLSHTSACCGCTYAIYRRERCNGMDRLKFLCAKVWLGGGYLLDNACLITNWQLPGC